MLDTVRQTSRAGERLLTKAAVAERYSRSLEWVRRSAKNGDIPHPVYLGQGKNRPMWRASEIEAHIRSLTAQ